MLLKELAEGIQNNNLHQTELVVINIHTYLYENIYKCIYICICILKFIISDYLQIFQIEVLMMRYIYCNCFASRKKKKYFFLFQIPLGICQVYNGATCRHYLSQQHVFVPPNLSLTELEERLKAAYGVIKESK